MKISNKPQFQEFHIEGVQHIAPSDAFEMIINDKAVMIDVREEDEIRSESIPLQYVLSHPMSLINDRLPFIAKDQQIILVCANGIRSAKVAKMMSLIGYPAVANLDGGINIWKTKGFPVKRNLTFTLASGCGCGCKTDSSDNADGTCC